jgi:phage shock protein A
MSWLLGIVLLIATYPALAQQPATALQRCGNDVGNLAIHADDLSEQLDKAKVEIADLKKQIEDAKAAKSEEKK